MGSDLFIGICKVFHYHIYTKILENNLEKIVCNFSKFFVIKVSSNNNAAVSQKSLLDVGMRSITTPF